MAQHAVWRPAHSWACLHRGTSWSPRETVACVMGSTSTSYITSNRPKNKIWKEPERDRNLKTEILKRTESNQNIKPKYPKGTEPEHRPKFAKEPNRIFTYEIFLLGQTHIKSVYKKQNLFGTTSNLNWKQLSMLIHSNFT